MSDTTSSALGALVTDLYQLNMLQVFHEEDMREEAVCDLSIRKLPKSRNYLIACGLEEAIDELLSLRFTDQDLDALRDLDHFEPSFLDALQNFRFSGDVWSVPEGSVVFANEPIVEIIAPLPEAQLAESLLLNRLQLPILVASKTSRIVEAAGDRPLFEFGLRRAHGPQAALGTAQAFWVGGGAATSNVQAATACGIPHCGTMSHSFVQACTSELQAFRTFVKTFPETSMLVDTYDTLEGVKKVTRLARELGEKFRVRAIRIDSGSLEKLSKAARQILDDAELTKVQIIASGDLDEHRIRSLIDADAPIDAFAIGARLAASADAPTIDLLYQLAAYDGRGRVRLSPNKETLPDRKQVFRFEEAGTFTRDVVALHDEKLKGEPRMHRVVHSGNRSEEGGGLRDARERCRHEVSRLPQELRGLGTPTTPYPVEVHPRLLDEQSRLRDALL